MVTTTTRPLAATSFMSGPEDDLITADVYTSADDGVVNNIKDVDPNDLVASDPTITDDLRGLSPLPSSVTDLPSVTSSGLASVKSAASSATGSASSLLSKLSSAVSAVASIAGPSILSRIASGGGISGIPGLGGGSNPLGSILRNAPASLTSALNSPIVAKAGTYANLNGVSTRIGAQNVTSSYQMSGVINSVTGTSTANMVDHDSTSNLIGALVKSSLQSGIPNSFSSVKSLAGNNPSILASAANLIMPMIKSTGNVSALRDVSTTVDTTSLRNSNNNVLGDISHNYTLPTNCSAADMNSEYSNVTSTFNLYDPSWDSKPRLVPDVTNPIPGQFLAEPTIDLTTIQNGSKDFSSVMQTGALNAPDDSRDKYYTLATAFPATSPESSLKSSFPMSYTTIDTDTIPNVDLSNTVDSTSNVSDYVV